MKPSKSLLSAAIALNLLAAGMAPALADNTGGRISNVFVGADNNSAENPIVQPQDPALAGGGIDQSMQFGDVLSGTRRHDVLIGRLGVDILDGGSGNDVLIGGTEHFNPQNRDRAFGGRGHDVFIWAPGDGSDLFHGDQGDDAVVFGLIGEIDGNGETVFRVSNDRLAGEIDLDPSTWLPSVNVSGSPGFCEVIDRSTSAEAAAALDDLDLDHLVRFTLRGVRDAFEAGQQNTDNGVRVTLHLKDVEVLVCTSRDGGQVELLDLTVSPPAPLDPKHLNPALRKRLQAMVF